jgi:hypothetical protein
MSKRVRKIVVELETAAARWEEEAVADRLAGRAAYAKVNEERAREARAEAKALRNDAR